ncbi:MULTISPECIES: opioid growth factor receptor-related protein [Nonomuraea]|uniref:Opioid growth factor receptor-related protein n=1 Tax=Nonomuraea ferruginea TaxID=46174 RepID=A0ABT4SU38_9ACTN|nr:opioid growth factor receptor-related protein [Nonomuraea ferruginea]MDA0640664.1 opioid growth factor receptor-related protein [Nonomuraea ferruginea]
MKTSAVVAFYRQIGTDDRGRSLDDVRSQDFLALEAVHDYIQWLFPLPEPSMANHNAPVLNENDIEAFRSDRGLQDELTESLLRMLAFYGLRLDGPFESPRVSPGGDFSDRASVWLTPYNHNFLRISRILRSLTVLGLEKHAQALLACLEEIYQEYADVIGATSVRYWRNAVVK